MKTTLLLFFLFYPSCTLLSKLKNPSEKKTPLKSEVIKPQKKKQSLESQIVTKAKKQILSRPLTEKQVKNLKKILKAKQSARSKEPLRMILGQHFFKKSSHKIALSYYSQVTKQPWKTKALLQKAKIYYQKNKPKKALHFIELFLEEDPATPDLLVKAYLLKLALISNNSSPDDMELLKIYCHILHHKNEKTSIYKEKAKNLVFRIKKAHLLDIKSEDFIKPVQDLVFFRVGKILFHRGKFKKAGVYFKKFLRISTESTLEEKTLKYLQAIESRKKVNRRHIGAVFPLSGPSAHIGKRSLNGLKMGLGFYVNKESHFQLTVLDSQGQPDKARKAVQTLVTKHHVIAIVGGVLSNTAKALAEETENFGVPAILMSQKSELTKTGRYIFQNGLTSALSARILTDYLINELNIKNFAILYPNDPYGVDYANAFWSAVERKGGKITGVQFYKPGETDFNEPIRRLTGLYYLKDRVKEYKDNLESWYLKQSYVSKRKAPPLESLLMPVVNFEVLFIPDSLKTLSLIAPHIAYNDIKNIKLAGPSLWNQKNFFKKHLKYMDNIVFPDPGLSTDKFKKTHFYKQFSEIFHQTPGLFEVLAYESALALNQVISSGADTRSELRKDLASLKSFHGPMGETVISPKREFLRPINILKLKNNILLPVKTPAMNQNNTPQKTI